VPIPKQIWCYWMGQKPDYIAYCLDTIQRRSGVPVTILNPDTVDAALDGVLHPNFKQIKHPAQRTDCIRIGLLYKHGGCWCDADTIMVGDCSHLFDIDCDAALSRWTYNEAFLNGYILSVPKGRFISTCLEDINRNLKKGAQAFYPDANSVFFGEMLFHRILKENPEFPIHRLPLSVFVPIEFPFHPRGVVWELHDSLLSFIKKDTVAIAVNHSQLDETVRNATVGQLCNRNNLFGDIFRYSKRLDWTTKYVLEYECADGDLFGSVCVESIRDLFDNVRKKGEGEYETNHAYFTVTTGDLWDRKQVFDVLSHMEENPALSAILSMRYDCVKNPFFKPINGKLVPVLTRDRCVGNKTSTIGNYFNFAHVGKSLTDVLTRCPHDADWVHDVWNKLPFCGGFERVPYAALPPSIGNIPLVRCFIGRAIANKRQVSITQEMMLLVPWPKGLPEGFNEKHPLYKQPSYRNRYLAYIDRLREAMGTTDE
jgi:hypothetical protein